jgi:hypothetical protein
MVDPGFFLYDRNQVGESRKNIDKKFISPNSLTIDAVITNGRMKISLEPPLFAVIISFDADRI